MSSHRQRVLRRAAELQLTHRAPTGGEQRPHRLHHFRRPQHLHARPLSLLLLAAAAAATATAATTALALTLARNIAAQRDPSQPWQLL